MVALLYYRHKNNGESLDSPLTFIYFAATLTAINLGTPSLLPHKLP